MKTQTVVFGLFSIAQILASNPLVPIATNNTQPALCGNSTLTPCPIECGETAKGNTKNYTRHFSHDVPGVLYSLNLTKKIKISASLCNGDSNFDTVLKVISAENTSRILCANDDFENCGELGGLSRVECTVNENQILILVSGFKPFYGEGHNEVNYTLSLECGPADYCLGAKEVQFPLSLLHENTQINETRQIQTRKGYEFFDNSTNITQMCAESGKWIPEMILRGRVIRGYCRQQEHKWGTVLAGNLHQAAEVECGSGFFPETTGALCATDTHEQGRWYPEPRCHSVPPQQAIPITCGQTVTNTTQNKDKLFDMKFGGVIYRLTLAQPSHITASTCKGADFDTYVTIMDESHHTLSNNDDHSGRCESESYTGQRLSHTACDTQPDSVLILVTGFEGFNKKIHEGNFNLTVACEKRQMLNLPKNSTKKEISCPEGQFLWISSVRGFTDDARDYILSSTHYRIRELCERETKCELSLDGLESVVLHLRLIPDGITIYYSCKARDDGEACGHDKLPFGFDTKTHYPYVSCQNETHVTTSLATESRVSCAGGKYDWNKSELSCAQRCSNDHVCLKGSSCTGKTDTGELFCVLAFSPSETSTLWIWIVGAIAIVAVCVVVCVCSCWRFDFPCSCKKKSQTIQISSATGGNENFAFDGEQIPLTDRTPLYWY